MTNLLKHSILSFFFVAGCLCTVAAQQGAEQQVMIEQLFIEAKQAQLLEKKEEAVRLYEQLVEKDAGNAAANYELALLHRSLNRLDKAIERAKKATMLSKGTAEADYYEQLYLTLVEISGNHDVLVAYYEEAVKASPEEIGNYYEWAHYLIKANELGKAIKVYDKIVKKTKLTSFVALKQVELYKRMGKLKKAEKVLLALEKTAPKNPDFKLHLANFYELNQSYDKAEKYYRAVLVLDERNSKANLALVSSFLENKDTVKYLKALEPIFEDKLQSTEEKIKTLKPWITKLLNQKDWKYAAQVSSLSKLLHSVAGNHPEVNYLRGEVLYLQGDIRAALSCFNISLKRYPNKVPLLLRRLDCWFEMGDKKALIRATRNFRTLYPNQLKGMLYGAVTLHLSRKYKASEELLDEVADLLTTQQHLKGLMLHYKAMNAAQQNEAERAKKVFKEALLYIPESIPLMNDFATFLYNEQVELDKALSLSNKALELRPRSIESMKTKAKILYRKEAYKEVITLLRDRVEGIQDAEVHELYGDALFKNGQEGLAVKSWEQARTLGGGSSLLLKKIENRRLYE